MSRDRRRCRQHLPPSAVESNPSRHSPSASRDRPARAETEAAGQPLSAAKTARPARLETGAAIRHEDRPLLPVLRPPRRSAAARRPRDRPPYAASRSRSTEKPPYAAKTGRRETGVRPCRTGHRTPRDRPLHAGRRPLRGRARPAVARRPRAPSARRPRQLRPRAPSAFVPVCASPVLNIKLRLAH